MVELVDTQDLKSCGHCGRAGSSPAPGTITSLPFFPPDTFPTISHPTGLGPDIIFGTSG